MHETDPTHVAAVVRLPPEVARAPAPSFEVRDASGRVLDSAARALVGPDAPVSLLLATGPAADADDVAAAKNAAIGLVLRIGPSVPTRVLDPRQAPAVAGRADGDVAGAVDAIANLRAEGPGASTAVERAAHAIAEQANGPHALLAFAPGLGEDPVPAPDLARALSDSGTVLYVAAPTADAEYWETVVDSSGGAVVESPPASGAQLAQLLLDQYVLEVDVASSPASPLEVRVRSGDTLATGRVVVATLSPRPAAEIAAAAAGVLLLAVGVTFARRRRRRRNPGPGRGQVPLSASLPSGAVATHVQPRRAGPRRRSAPERTPTASRHVRPGKTRGRRTGTRAATRARRLPSGADADVDTPARPAAAPGPQELPEGTGEQRSPGASRRPGRGTGVDSGPSLARPRPAPSVPRQRPAPRERPGRPEGPDAPGVAQTTVRPASGRPNPSGDGGHGGVVARCRALVDALDAGTRAADAGGSHALLGGLVRLVDAWPATGRPPTRTAATLSTRLSGLEPDYRRGTADAEQIREVLAEVVDTVDGYWWARVLMPPSCAAALRGSCTHALTAARGDDLRPARELAAILRSHWARVGLIAAADTESQTVRDAIRSFGTPPQPGQRPAGYHGPAPAVEELNRLVGLVDTVFQTRSQLARQQTAALRSALRDHARRGQ